MSDVTVTTETPTTPTMEAPLPNSPEARTEDGSLKSPATTPSTETTTLTTKETPSKPEGAPEKYETFKAPEGYELGADLIEAATPIFKELGLNQDAAQKLVDFYAKQQMDAAKAPETAYKAMRDGWRGDVMKDSTLSDGKALRPEISESIGKLINSLPADQAAKFREVMDTTGVGDNATMIRALAEWSKNFVEPKHVAGGGPSPHGQKSPGASERPTAASSMYPNLK